MTDSEMWTSEASRRVAFVNKDSTYGTPPKGSKTEERAIKAGQHINNEVQILVSVIRGIGRKEPDSEIYRVRFGKLFEYYTTISNKVVGILLRARRWNLVDFDGEMLYQRRDDDKLITLLVGPDVVPTIRHFVDYIGDERKKPETLKDKLLKLNQASK